MVELTYDQMKEVSEQFEKMRVREWREQIMGDTTFTWHLHNHDYDDVVFLKRAIKQHKLDAVVEDENTIISSGRDVSLITGLLEGYRAGRNKAAVV